MAATPCALCATVCSPEQRRKLYGSSTANVISMLTAIVEDLYGVGTIPVLFPGHSSVCRPCWRALEKLAKMKEDLRQMEDKLYEQLKQIGEGRCVQQLCLEQVPPTTPLAAQQVTPRKRHHAGTAGGRLPLEDSPSKRRAIANKKDTPVRAVLHRKQPSALLKIAYDEEQRERDASSLASPPDSVSKTEYVRPSSV